MSKFPKILMPVRKIRDCYEDNPALYFIECDIECDNNNQKTAEKLFFNLNKYRKNIRATAMRFDINFHSWECVNGRWGVIMEYYDDESMPHSGWNMIDSIWESTMNGVEIGD